MDGKRGKKNREVMAAVREGYRLLFWFKVCDTQLESFFFFLFVPATHFIRKDGWRGRLGERERLVICFGEGEGR